MPTRFLAGLIKTSQDTTTNRWSKVSWWVVLLILLAATFIRVGESVPWRNEFFYLARLIRTFDPSYIPVDWTLGTGAPEHFAFNHLFGGLGLVLPLEVLGWVGRVAFWTINLWTLLLIAKRLAINPWSTAVVIAVWLGMGQSLVGYSWIFGTFEAKVVAYAILHLGLLLCFQGRIPLVGLAAGLAFTFHPSVGLWGGLALAGMAVFTDRNPRKLSSAAGLAIVGALPGLLAVFPMLRAEHGATVDDWRLMVLIKMPHHLDPKSWPIANRLLVGFMFAFNLFHARATGSIKWRQLALFQILTGLPFLLGLAFRQLEAWQSLSYFPFRLFPLYTPLFFGFAVADGLGRRDAIRLPRTAIAIAILCLISLPNPYIRYVHAVPRRMHPVVEVDTGLRACCEWIRGELPTDAQGIAPPGLDREIWYYAERGLIVSSEFQSYHRLSEWRQRVESLGGEMTASRTRRQDLLEHYDQLTETELRSIIHRYNPDFVIARQIYDLPLGFDSGSFRVYLPASGMANNTPTD